MKKEIVNEKFEMMTCEDIAERLKVSLSMVYKLTRTQQIPYCKIGSSTRIRSCDLDKYIEDTLINQVY